MKVIRFGRKELVYSQFSNYYTCSFEYDRVRWNSAEAAFQSMKSLDRTVRESFANFSAGESKKRGRTIELRPDWERVKFSIMEEIVHAKFNQNENLKEVLLSTKDALLIENTTGWHDNSWGCCSCPKCSSKLSRNMLGICLMRVRARLAGAAAIVRYTLDGDDRVFNFSDNSLLQTMRTDISFAMGLDYTFRHAE